MSATADRLSRVVAAPGSWVARDAVLATIAKGAGIALLLQLVGVGLRGLIQITFARAMGIEAFGQYTLIIGLVLIIGTVANLGLQLALIRLRAEYEAGGQASYLRGLLLAARVLPFAIGAVVAAAAGIAISTLGLGQLPARALILGMLAVVSSTGGCNSVLEFSGWGHEAEGLTGAGVQFQGDAVQVLLAVR